MFDWAARVATLFIIALLCVGLAACGGGDSRSGFDDDDDGGNGDGDDNGGDGTPPTVAFSPVGAIAPRQPIMLTFSESMDTDSVELGGALGEAAEMAWESDDFNNDTLILTPSTRWPNGTQNLSVDGADTDGDAMQTANAQFNVKVAFNDFQPATVVIGQADFESGAANQGGAVDANTLDNPTGTAGHAPEANALFVPDTGSARVLGFNDVPSANNMNADFVIAQPDFSSDAAATSATAMRAPQTVTATAGKLVVTDRDSHRVLIYDNVPASGPVAAAVVLGQADFEGSAAGCSATAMNNPEAHFVTPDGRLLVADSGNHRVLIWNQLPTANAAPPDLVLGQDSFENCTANDDDQDNTPSPDWPPQSFTLSYPTGIWSDGEKLLVADSGNNRVLIWNSFPAGNFAPADMLLGQNSFRTMAPNDDDQDGVTDASGEASQHVFDFPFGVWSDGVQIFVADRDNHRVLVWDEYPSRYFTGASSVLGQQNFSNNASNDTDQDGTDDGAPSAATFNRPTGVRLIGDRLTVTDSGNSRVLIFESE